ncbi:dihydroorotate dehydrogenase B-like protein [Actinocorallia herbida]|uniref:Dihydroorotate dehydrogenase B-like protein n=1 Tax=Actinocorallia herbida TaxID=58109 RepID=A0A3N1D4N7_9ACTN|nr:hypothetical protein [Actinocorallia herbida]ROO88495.1 dihydroorotate dehydrogenase B-like protein [Actinocorallia herbida]
MAGRYRTRSTAPRRYRIVDRYAEAPGELTLVLAPEGSDGPEGADGTDARVPVPSAAGRFWVLHTATGQRLPAADVSARRLHSDGTTAESSLVEVRALRLPCGPRTCRIGEVVGLSGPRGLGWNLEAATGLDLLVVGWERGLGLLRPVVERVLAESARYRELRVWAAGAVWSATGTAAPTATAPSGRLTPGGPDAPALRFDPAATVALLAGPLAEATATAVALHAQGTPAERIQIAAHELLSCGSGRCGGCRVEAAAGPVRVCADGPVLRYDQLPVSARLPRPTAAP